MVFVGCCLVFYCFHVDRWMFCFEVPHLASHCLVVLGSLKSMFRSSRFLWQLDDLDVGRFLLLFFSKVLKLL